jgi:flagellar hook-length control protein FliK
VLPTRGGETPFVVPTPASTAPATVAGAATANAPAPLAQQLARPLFTLAQAGPGEHVVTVQVSPDALGPVTVRAHVTAHGMHVELFAASDAGRDAVRQVLPDLRRDAAGSAVVTTLDLSSQNHPDAQPGRDDRRTPAGFRPEAGPEARPTTTAPVTTRPTTVRSVGLDVLA